MNEKRFLLFLFLWLPGLGLPKLCWIIAVRVRLVPLSCSWTQRKCFQFFSFENVVCCGFVLCGLYYVEVGSLRIPWRRPGQTTPVFLHGESPRTKEPGGLWSIGSQRVWKQFKWISTAQVLSMPTFWRVFIINEYWVLSKAFSASIRLLYGFYPSIC